MKELELDYLHERIERLEQMLVYQGVVMMALFIAVIALVAVLYFKEPQVIRETKVETKIEYKTIEVEVEKEILVEKELSISYINENDLPIFAQHWAWQYYAQQYDIDIKLLLAVSMHETGWWESEYFQLYNNVCGMLDPKTHSTKPLKYDTMAEGIKACAANLAWYRDDFQLTSIPQIGAKWAPIGTANDPNNKNRHWISKVQKLYDWLDRMQ